MFLVVILLANRNQPETILSAPNGEGVHGYEEFNPRESQTNYHKTRLPQIQKQPRQYVMSHEGRVYSSVQGHLSPGTLIHITL